jgi:ADP-ribose pyrophosphatase YjhB (NUDIX family)
MNKFRYCHQCSSESISFKIPDDDTHHRHVCDTCLTIFYENPKIVVGAVTLYEGKFLLCRRAIEPQKGLWTYPAGYLENQESLEQGVQREAREEAGVSIKLTRLLGTYSLAAVDQVHIIYAAEMIKPEFAPGKESLEVALFAKDDIPWDDLAFPVIRWALEAYINNKPCIDSKESHQSLEASLMDASRHSQAEQGRHRTSYYLLVSLMLAGVIPFIFLASLLYFNWLPQAKILAMLFSYAAIILTFLGGIQWGIGVVKLEEKSLSHPHIFTMSILPSLLAWLLLMIDQPKWQLIGFLASFALVLAVDIVLTAIKLLPRWFLRLRLSISLVVMMSLILSYAAL